MKILYGKTRKFWEFGRVEEEKEKFFSKRGRINFLTEDEIEREVIEREIRI